MHDSEQEHSGITGCRVTYESTIFYNEANKFSIIVVKTSDPRIPPQACSGRYYGDRMLRFTAVGYELPRTKAVELELDGEWVESKYGYQLQVEQWQEIVPQTADGLLAYLGSGLIKGIGPKTAARIVEHFGEQTLLVMEREPERLAEVPGISREKAKAMGEEFRLQVGMRQLMEFFAVHHLPAELAVRAYKLYGDSTVELLYDDPYLLMDEGLDAPFGAVDRFAIELGVAGDDPRRVEAGILFELNYNLTAGHSFLPEDKLQLAVSQLLSVDGEAVKQGIGRLLEADRLVRSTLAGITVDYLPRLYEAEVNCSRRLLEFAKGSFPPPKGLERMIQNVAEESGVEYSE